MKINLNPDVCLLLEALIKEFDKKNHKFHNAYMSREHFLARPLPNTSEDIPHISDDTFAQIAPQNHIYLRAAKQLLGAVECTNAIVYPAGHIMGWHTNSDLVGLRTYYVYSEKPGLFAYLKDGQMVLDEDNAGWTARTFKVSKDQPLWHTVWADTQRYAFGFRHVV